MFLIENKYFKNILKLKSSWKFVCKISNLKNKMSSLGSKSSNNIFTRKRIRVGEETNNAENKGTKIQKTEIELSSLYLHISANQEQALN